MNIKKGLGIIWFRLSKQGVRVSFFWAIDHLVRRVTGAPVRSVSEIAPLVHVGGQYKRHGWKRLVDRGIGAVVNMRIEYDDQAYGIAPQHYLYLPTIDDAAPSLDQLDEGVRFIHKHVENGAGVYIHCASGVGRAATMAAAYFMSQGMSKREAIAYIHAKRPFIKISDPQAKQMEIFEQSQPEAIA